MKAETVRYNSISPNFKGGIYNSKTLKNVAEFASSNSALFCAGTSFLMRSTVRPLAILSTPNTSTEDKKYAIAKSLTSGVADVILTTLIATPFSKAIKNIEKNPTQYLKDSTLQNLKTQDNITSSKEYQFIAQLFKLGLTCAIALPKSSITSFLIPKIVKLFNFKKKEDENKKDNSSKISFKGKMEEKLTGFVSSVVNDKTIQNLATKLKNTNYKQNMMFLSDIILTSAFVRKTSKNNNIEEKRKKPLILNSILSTAFSMISTLTVDKLIDNKYQDFVQKFVKENAKDAKLNKYLEGLDVIKTTLIISSMYYIVIPIISTFLSGKISKSKDENPQNN